MVRASVSELLTAQRWPFSNLKVSSTTPDPVSGHFTILSRGQYIRVGDLDVALVTAVYYKNFPVKMGFNVFVNGWAKNRSPMNFKCCFLKHQNETNIEFVETMASLYHIYTKWEVDMQNAEFSCSVSEKQLKTFGVNDTYQYVSFAVNSCNDAPKDVLKIEHRKTIPKSVGLCLKISYGFLSPELVVEWFEYQKLMGVTKVYSFLADDLEPSVRKVFKYYDSIGFAETDPIDPAPSNNGSRRGFRRPRWEEQAWVDEVMAINDCKHRMAGMDFVLVHDIDEFIVPKSPQDNIYTILKKTLTKYPRAGAFSFDSHVAMLNWGPTRNSPLHVMQYTNLTSKPNFDDPGRDTRWGFISDRIFYGRNNRMYPRVNFKAVQVRNTLFTLIHRRMCKPHWKNCNSTEIRRPHETILRYEDMILHNMQKLPLQKIRGPNSTQYIKDIMAWKP